MTRDNTQVQQGLLLLGVSFVVTIATGVIGYYFSGDHEPIVGSLITTGRLAFLIFLIPLFASPLRTLFKNAVTAALMRWRRNAGILYGGAQGVHLIIVCAMFVQLSDPPTETIMVLVGSGGLALAIAMLITSFPKPTRALGPRRWKILHKSGFYVFMFIYFFDFVVEPLLLNQPTSHLIWAVLTVAGMTVRPAVMCRRPANHGATG